MPFIDRFPARGQEPTEVSLALFINALKTASVRKTSQAIELQIDSALENLDFDTLLDPMMPNTGGMEVLATIKRDLSLKLETMLTAQRN